MKRIRKKIRLRTVAVFALAGLSGAILLRTSQNVQQAEERVAELTASIAQEEDSIRVLNAEWAYLNNPERLERLNKEYLGLMPPQPATIVTNMDEVPSKTDLLLDEIPTAPLAAQPAAYQTPANQTPKAAPAKSSDISFTHVLENIRKGMGR